MPEEELGFTTRALGSGAGEVTQRPIGLPLYQTASFAFDDMEDFAAVAKTKISGGYLYTRWANPTVEALARTIASLEGAEATACFASGMGAIHGTLTALLANGDHVVSATQLYGGTHGLLSIELARAGIDAAMVDITDHGAVEAAFTERTRVLYAETIGNPTLPVTDLDALAAIARAHEATLVVDATFTPPYLLRPLERGVDLVVHSATKYLSGHGDVTAGVVSGSAEHIARIRHHQIDSGGILAPFEAWLCARGVETLALRMDRICDTALALAQRLEAHPGVQRVMYPGLASHPQHELARALLGERFGGMIAFEVAGGVEAGRRVLDRVRIASPAASLGATKTLIVHPASITHTQLTREQRETVGVTDGMIRLSVGIEDSDDLIRDLERALD